MSWFQRIADAWGEGEPIDNDPMYEVEPSMVPQEAAFVAILVVIATTFFVAWKMSSAIGRVLTLIKETFWFLIRLTLTLTLVVVAFNYFAPDEVRKEAGEFTTAVTTAVFKAPWYSHALNLIAKFTNVYKNLKEK